MTDDTKKFDQRVDECVVLVYPEGIKGYRLWSLKYQRVIFRLEQPYIHEKITDIGFFEPYVYHKGTG